MYLLEKMYDDNDEVDEDDDDDNDDEEFVPKFVSEINCISHVEVKEEVIIPENTSDGESTLSDNEKNPDTKLDECLICCKYRSMFIILKNHECQSEGDEKCKFCTEITHWSNCFKSHRDSYHLEKESDFSSDSTTSDREENEGKCRVCLKYEFMVPLLKSHVCQSNTNQKCPDCSEVLHWMTCYKNHVDSHDTRDVLIKEENSSDSTISDNEEIQKLLSPVGNVWSEKCQICLKYQGMFIILEENHICDVEKPDKNCQKCNEIIHWYSCFDGHRRAHQGVEKNDSDTKSKFSHFGGKFDCGICLKLNSIVTHLVKNHKCINSKSCAVCKEVSYWLSCLKDHKQSEVMYDVINGEELEAFKNLILKSDCAVCLKFHATIVNLSDHVCNHKRGRQKCITCLEVSFWYRNFKLHEKHHTNQFSPLKNFFTCSSCGKRFSCEKMLKVHKSYCKNSNLTCDTCNGKFVDMFSLKKHKIFNSCHTSNITLQYKCKVCNKTFSNSSKCKAHEDFHNLKLFKYTKALSEFKSEVC